MQYNYINMREIEGGDKISISRVLANSSDLSLFSNESIQVIIDYKWNTHAFKFFRLKFMFYIIFMLTFFWDNEKDHISLEE